RYLSDELTKGVREFIAQLDPEILQRLLAIVRLAKKIDLFLDKRECQDDLFAFFKSWKGVPQAVPQVIRDQEGLFFQFMGELDLSTDRLKKLLNTPY
ncbi:MAG: hypothetical protein KTQ49_08435, partial [Candidatus Omnitrophica bacterium]|nr:hypothetical protein [Candidatus Omnitrophota bacterium]